MLALLLSCGTKKEQLPKTETAPPMETKNKTPAEKGSTENSFIVSGPVLEKVRLIKSEIQGETDFFLQRSVQDYFIKFCESQVSRSELEAYLNKQKTSLKTLHAEIEYREGEWDSCDENEKVASRTGKYIVLLQLLD